jgi:hypothetical protein
VSLVPPIDPDEILLRRVPPSSPSNRTVVQTEDGVERPASNTMRPRDDEHALSCSRLLLTSPGGLLRQLAEFKRPIDPAGWRVCWFRVRDIEAIQDGDNGHLVVTTDPRTDPPADLGHCGIYGSAGGPCPRSKGAAKRLAEAARLLTSEQVASLKAGDSID